MHAFLPKPNIKGIDTKNIKAIAIIAESTFIFATIIKSIKTGINSKNFSFDFAFISNTAKKGRAVQIKAPVRLVFPTVLRNAVV